MMYSVCPMQPYTRPACMLVVVSRARMLSGFSIAISGSFAVSFHKAFAQMRMPGLVIPVSNTQPSSTRS